MQAGIARRAIASTLLIVLACPTAPAEPTSNTPASDPSATSDSIDEVTVMARRIALIGNVSSASEGVVADVEGIGSVCGVEVGIDVVADELGLLDELDEPEGGAVKDV